MLSPAPSAPPLRWPRLEPPAGRAAQRGACAPLPAPGGALSVRGPGPSGSKPTEDLAWRAGTAGPGAAARGRVSDKRFTTTSTRFSSLSGETSFRCCPPRGLEAPGFQEAPRTHRLRPGRASPGGTTASRAAGRAARISVAAGASLGFDYPEPELVPLPGPSGGPAGHCASRATPTSPARPAPRTSQVWGAGAPCVCEGGVFVSSSPLTLWDLPARGKA